MSESQFFFTKFLDNDLNKLSQFLLKRYEEINTQSLKNANITKLNDKIDKFVDSKSISTIKYQEYNVFQFYNKEIYNLFLCIRETTKEACKYYKYDYDQEEFMIQGWFNINYSKLGKLNFHDHGPRGVKGPFFHGYYCVNAEPSETIYQINNKDVINTNKNNCLIISPMGNLHAMKDWDWDGPRITIAYDIIPLRFLIANKNAIQQHWIPL
jgi:hypothetical protein